MSKLLSIYENLKSKNPNKLYLLKSGIFYVALDDDALILSDIFNFKIIDLNADSIKCGFPISKIDFYSKKLLAENIDFEIINPNEFIPINYSIQKYRKIIDDILSIDLNTISFKDAFYKLEDFQNYIRNNIDDLKS